ncbi:MAG: fluoride efflux transporter CrcB [Bdellovibrionales bacterium]
MINTIAAIALGGSIGAVLRYLTYLLSLKLVGESFPWGTLVINILGCFLMGVAVSVFASMWTPPEQLRAFLIAGVLSSFTTFSAFSLDVIHLMEREQYLYMSLYYLSSVTLSIAAILLAITLVKGFIS